MKLLFLVCIIFSFQEARSNPLLPGLFESLEKIITLDNTESSNWKNATLASESDLLAKSRTGTTFFLAPEFLQTILFNASAQQLEIMGHNPCAIADYAWLDQLRHGKGSVTSVPLLYSDNKASYTTLWVSRQTWAKYLMSTSCKKSEEMAYLFSSNNLNATLKKFSPEYPKDEPSCKKQLENVLKDEKTPYYCYLHSAAIKGEVSLELLKKSALTSNVENKKKLVLQSLKVKELLGNENFDYLRNLCENINNEDKYCNYFFSSDYWKKKIINKNHEKLLAPVCSDLSATECANKINRNNNFCLWSMIDYPSLLPRPSCLDSSTALNYTKLNINYRDCPARIHNSSITSASRILNHFGYDKILFAKNNKIQLPDQQWQPTDICSANNATNFLDFLHKVQWDDVWNAKVCFEDKLQRKNFCAPYVLSNLNNSAFSLSSTISEILKKAKRMDKSYTCQILDHKKFDPQLLKFRTGCWILITNTGELTSANFKVVVDDREQRGVFTVQGDVIFPYQSFLNSNQYHNFQFKIEKELGIKSYSLKTLPELTAFLKRPQAIAHGVGCLEELMPDFFPSLGINSCSPMSFIIAGVIPSKNLAEAAIVVHTAIDEFASPRLLPWHQIASAVEAYQKIHPQLVWSLYGLDR
jgi:hypothetical protein